MTFERTLTDDVAQVEVYLCPLCDDEVDPDEAAERRVYECSRCGERVVPEEGERARCLSCNVFCAKVADASCPACEEEIELDDIVRADRWRTSDGALHESPADAVEWIANEEQRYHDHQRRRRETDEILERMRQESKERERQLVAAVEVARAHGVPIAWAHDGWTSWRQSASVFLDGRDLLALAGMTEDEFYGGRFPLDYDDLVEPVDRLYERLLAVGCDFHDIVTDHATDPRRTKIMFAASAKSLFTEHGFGQSQTSWNAEAFIAHIQQRWPH